MTSGCRIFMLNRSFSSEWPRRIVCGVIRSGRVRKASCTSGNVRVALLRISSVIPDHLYGQ